MGRRSFSARMPCCYDRELMRNVGVVVIDEQHKFGVAQRATPVEKASARRARDDRDAHPAHPEP